MNGRAQRSRRCWYCTAGSRTPARSRLMIEALRARGLRVVAFDAPAHGRSGGQRPISPAFAMRSRPSAAPVARCRASSRTPSARITAASWLAEDCRRRTRACAPRCWSDLPRDIGYLFESFSIAMALRRDVDRARARPVSRRYGGLPQDYSARGAGASTSTFRCCWCTARPTNTYPPSMRDEVALQLRDGQIEVDRGPEPQRAATRCRHHRADGAISSASTCGPGRVVMRYILDNLSHAPRSDARSARGRDPSVLRRAPAPRLSLFLHRQRHRDAGRQRRARHQLLGDVPEIPFTGARRLRGDFALGAIPAVLGLCRRARRPLRSRGA